MIAGCLDLPMGKQGINQGRGTFLFLNIPEMPRQQTHNLIKSVFVDLINSKLTK